MKKGQKLRIMKHNRVESGSQQDQVCLGQYLFHNVPVHVGKAHVAAAEAEGALCVLDSEQVEHRRMEIVYFIAILHGFVAPLIGLPN